MRFDPERPAASGSWELSTGDLQAAANPPETGGSRHAPTTPSSSTHPQMLAQQPAASRSGPAPAKPAQSADLQTLTQPLAARGSERPAKPAPSAGLQALTQPLATRGSGQPAHAAPSADLQALTQPLAARGSEQPAKPAPSADLPLAALGSGDLSNPDTAT